MLKQITEATQGNITIHDKYDTGSWEVMPRHDGDAVYFIPYGTLYKVKIPYHTYYNTYDVWISIDTNVEYFMVRTSMCEDDVNFYIHQITLQDLYDISPSAALKAVEIVKFENEYATYRK